MPKHFLILCIFFYLLFTPLLANSAEFTVNRNVDRVDINPGDGICNYSLISSLCSLRAAIQEANLTPEDDTIILPTLSQNYVITISNAESEDLNISGDFDILQGSITIIGDSRDTTIIDANSVDRIFDVKFGTKLVLSNMALTEGNSLSQNLPNGQIIQTDGGAVRNQQGTLILNNVHIYNNKSQNMGAGVYFQGTIRSNLMDAVGYLEINNSLIVSNSPSVTVSSTNGVGVGIAIDGGEAVINGTLIKDNPPSQLAVMGGGIYSYGDIEIKNSAIIGNYTMTDGGGIYHLLGSLTITNTTIADNYARRSGGGLFYRQGYVGMPDAAIENKITLTNVTFINNVAAGIDNTATMMAGPGAILGPSEVGVLGGHDIALTAQDSQEENKISIVNSIVNECKTHVNASIVSAGNNISSSSTCNFVKPSDLQNTSAMLDPLANNGAFTESYAPQAGSPAIDNANDWYCPDTDQRGVLRPTTLCDIGAYEEMPLIATPYVYVATIGAPTVGILRTHYPNGDGLTFEIVMPPTQGSVGFFPPGDPDVPYISGQFAYLADLNASGTDSFTFRACDNVTSECSNTAEISFSFLTATVSEEIKIEIIDDSGAIVTPLDVVETNLSAEIADVDFTSTLGVFFFDVKDIPINAANYVRVTIQFPWSVDLPSSSVIRKLDISGQWRTLPSSGSGISTGSINFWGRRVTLTIYDNDGIFDSNPAVGIISDPFMISVPLEKDEEPVNNADQNTPSQESTNASSLQNTLGAPALSKGAGAISYFILGLFLLFAVRKQKA